MSQHGGKREGSGRTPLPQNEKKIAKTIYITPTLQDDINHYASGDSFSYSCNVALDSILQYRTLILFRYSKSTNY